LLLQRPLEGIFVPIYNGLYCNVYPWVPEVVGLFGSLQYIIEVKTFSFGFLHTCHKAQ